MANTLVIAAQVLSTSCDLDGRLESRNVFRKLLPETQEQKLAFTSGDLDNMTKVLEAVRDLVVRCGTIEHKNEFHGLCKLCRKHNVTLQKLETCIKDKEQGWADIFRWDDDIRSKLKNLRNQVAKDKLVVFRASVKYRAELVDAGMVTITIEESPEGLQSSANDATTPTLSESNSLDREDLSKLQKIPKAIDIEMTSLSTGACHYVDPLGAVTSFTSNQV
ncbi:hypothetical protein C8J55DRAFT_548247 [Lentinula edodes]|uniref:Uncharacterized protein n=1 Tax=Lentinula lateritia TaxID=40482 RepID=A0A9W9AMV3_9AGAR|nr:hypothetical protein C8J55DRAFT_548247 [Lentinula edodes]